MRSRIAGAPFACFALLSVLLATGCGGGGKSSVDTSRRANTKSPRTRRMTAADLTLPFVAEKETAEVGVYPKLTDELGGPFGDPLDTTITAMRPTPLPDSKVRTMPEDKLVAYLDSLVYELEVPEGELGLLPCLKLNGRACKDEKVAVYVQPEIGFDSLKVKDIGENGVIAARFINYDYSGQNREKAFRIPSHTYAWLLIERSGDNLIPAVIWRETTASGAFKLGSQQLTKFYGCPGPEHARGSARRATAKWWDCNQQALYSASRVLAPRVGRSARFSFAAYDRSAWPALQDSTAPGDSSSLIYRIGDGSVWITCSLGCCIAQ